MKPTTCTKTLCPYVENIDCAHCQFDSDNRDFGDDYEGETNDAMRVDYDEKDPW